MKIETLDKGRVRIAIDATDETSTLNQAEVSIDTGEWQAVFPKDGIIDSKSESFSYLSVEFPSGEHVIAFRIYDQNDNVAWQSCRKNSVASSRRGRGTQTYEEIFRLNPVFISIVDATIAQPIFRQPTINRTGQRSTFSLIRSM